MKTKILVYIEFLNKFPIRASLELLNYTNIILNSKNRADFNICAVVFSDDSLSNEVKDKIYSAGAESIFNVCGEGFAEYNLYAQKFALARIIDIEHPDILLFSTTERQKELAPYLATSINAGLTADCTSLDILIDEGMPKLVSSRPTFGGRLMAEIMYKTYPNMATVKQGVAPLNFDHNFVSKELKKINLDFKSNNIFNILETLPAKNDELKLDSDCSIMFCGGFGLGSKSAFNKLNLLVKKLKAMDVNAGICATRKAVEKGFASKCLQVGQTGNFVTPDFYVAIGVSGAVHHMVGCNGSKKIIAVNSDSNSAIKSSCDYFIQSDSNEFIDRLINKI